MSLIRRIKELEKLANVNQEEMPIVCYVLPDFPFDDLDDCKEYQRQLTDGMEKAKAQGGPLGILYVNCSTCKEECEYGKNNE